MGINAAEKAIRSAGLTVTGFCQCGWFADKGAIDQTVMDDNRRAVDEAAELEAACLVMVVGGLSKDRRDLPGAWALVEEGLAKTLNNARGQGVKVAIELLHKMYAADRAFVNTMRQALDICDRLGDGIGCAVDVYHVWWDSKLEAQPERAGKDRIFAFHICDWVVPTRNLLTDRGIMGDGVIDIR